MSLSESHILLVEDTDLNAMIARRFLEQSGAYVQRAQNGQEALDLLKSQSFDIVLMDIHMPIMNGIETTKTLRENGYQGTILLMTAHEEHELNEGVSQMGFDGFVSKPTSSAKFIQDIQEAIQ